MSANLMSLARSGGKFLKLFGDRKMMKTMPTARDYVQDGLIAMWDGIENAGWGVHDQNATVWKDLIGGETVSSPSIVFTDNSLSLDGSYYMVGSKYYYANNGYSLEIVFSAHTSPPSSSAVVVFGSYHGCGINWQNSWQVNIGGAWHYCNWPEKINQVSMTLDKNGRVVYCHENQGYYEMSLSPFSYPYEVGLVKIGKGWNQVKTFDGEINCIRFYGRDLAQDEIAANYAIDKARFNLT